MKNYFQYSFKYIGNNSYLTKVTKQLTFICQYYEFISL